MKNTDRTDLNYRITLFRYEHIIPILNNDFVDKSDMQYCRQIEQNPVTNIDGKAIKVRANTSRHGHTYTRNMGMMVYYQRLVIHELLQPQYTLNQSLRLSY